MIRSLGVGLPSPENRPANTFIVPPSPKLPEPEPEYPRVCAVWYTLTAPRALQPRAPRSDLPGR
eukprot:2164665-Rhodomonas_salina.1